VQITLPRQEKDVLAFAQKTQVRGWAALALCVPDQVLGFNARSVDAGTDDARAGDGDPPSSADDREGDCDRDAEDAPHVRRGLREVAVGNSTGRNAARERTLLQRLGSKKAPATVATGAHRRRERRRTYNAVLIRAPLPVISMISPGECGPRTQLTASAAQRKPTPKTTSLRARAHSPDAVGDGVRPPNAMQDGFH